MKYFLAIVCLAVVACGASSSLPSFDSDVDAGPSYSAPDDSLGMGNCEGGGVWRHTPDSWVLTAPQLHLIFWGDWWYTNTSGQSIADKEIAAWSTLANDSAFYSVVNEYGVGTGQFEGAYLTYADVPMGSITDDQIQTELTKEIQNSTLPSATSNGVYMIVLPPDTTSQYDLDNNFDGHHGTLDNFTYAVVENHANLDFVISHEFYESSTNPDTSNGWWGPGGETEIADLCESYSWKLDGYTITTVWSEAQCQCIPQ